MFTFRLQHWDGLIPDISEDPLEYEHLLDEDDDDEQGFAKEFTITELLELEGKETNG